MDKKLFKDWQRFIPDLGEVLRQMQANTNIAVAMAPYPNIIPSLFLDRYLIYSVKDTADIDVLRNFASIACMEERFPKIAKKVQGTGYLLNNFAFERFIRAQREPFRLILRQVTPAIIQTLESKGWDWIGNRPESVAGVVLKGNFRDLVKSLGLPSIPDWRLTREAFFAQSFESLVAKWNRAVVVQRADFEVGGELGTFFLKTIEDWEKCRELLAKDSRWNVVTISPFIDGHSLSMLGCVTAQGVLSSMLQLQLIDIPESLHGQMPTGVFLGHDWGFQDWPESAERAAQLVVEEIGYHLSKQGFRGIFGVDFLYDKTTKEIFPLECNPRFTGALPAHSIMMLANGVPPLEFFHLMAQLNISAPFDFEGVNQALKQRLPFSHISLTPKGIYEMKLNLQAGIYSYNQKNGDFHYERPGAFYRDLKNQNEFILIDSVPRLGQSVSQNVPGFCKLMFPRRIAQSSFAIDPEIGALINAFSSALREDQTMPSKSKSDTAA